MLYLIQHAENDWRLHAEDGTEINSGNSRPDTRTQVDWLAEYHNGASILADPTARRRYTDIVTNNVNVIRRPRQAETAMLPWE